MKKVIVVLLSCVLGLILFVGCGDKKTERKQGESIKVKVDKNTPIEKLKSEFKKARFKVGNNELIVHYKMIGAISGEKFKLNGESMIKAN